MGVALFQGAEEEMCRATDQGCKWVGGWVGAALAVP